MIRYKTRRMSRSIGIAAPNKKSGKFIIHDYTHWKPHSPFPYERTLDWIISKGFHTAFTVFIGEGFEKSGVLDRPLSNADKLYSALTILNKTSGAKTNGISAVIPASRPTDWHEYWTEKVENETGKITYYVYYNQTDTEPFEILSAEDFVYDYVFTQPLRTIMV